MIYTTEHNERLDNICYRRYKSDKYLDLVLSKNPKLENAPLVLPYGTKILLPDIDIKKVQRKSLW